MDRADADASPWHAGERAVQARAGTRERMARIGPQLLREAMPEQHREFFALLPFVALGAADAGGQPWASLLAGTPGFVCSPDSRHLRIDALPAQDDPLAALLRPGASLGLLGIELQTRRRNRANGRIAARDERGLLVQVLQSFGNCPKYIQRRELLPSAAVPGPAQRGAGALDARASRLVREADTFFIATQAGQGGAASDVSHRGGRPGFVRVGDEGRTLTWPDFAGNGFFNTLGNIAVELRAGLVFVDFDAGALLHLSGRAEIVWDGAELARFAGAERLLRLRLDEWLYRPGAWPLRWRLVEASPVLAATGAW